MNVNRNLSKFVSSEVGGRYNSQNSSQPADQSSDPSLGLELSDSLDDVQDDVQSVLYPEASPLVPAKKHDADFVNSRVKARQIAATKLTHLSDELLKLADAVRYHHPLMAEALDDAWDATEAAITLMSYSEN